MSATRTASLSSYFAAFVGNTEAAVELVAAALVRAITIAGKDGTRAPLEGALSQVSSLVGRAERVFALRAGLGACGLYSALDGKAGDAVALADVAGMTIGKMTAKDAAALGERIGEAFTLGASTYLNTPRTKRGAKAVDKVGAAAETLAALTLTDLRKACAKGHGATLRGLFAMLAAEDAQAKARADADKAIAEAQAATAGATAPEAATV